jgi:hypothetical protein
MRRRDVRHDLRERFEVHQQVLRRELSLRLQGRLDVHEHVRGRELQLRMRGRRLQEHVRRRKLQGRMIARAHQARLRERGDQRRSATLVDVLGAVRRRTAALASATPATMNETVDTPANDRASSRLS